MRGPFFGREKEKVYKFLWVGFLRILLWKEYFWETLGWIYVSLSLDSPRGKIKCCYEAKKQCPSGVKWQKRLKVFRVNASQKYVQGRCPQKCVEGQHYQKTCQRMRMFWVRTCFWGVELPGELPTSDVDQLVLLNDMPIWESRKSISNRRKRMRWPQRRLERGDGLTRLPLAVSEMEWIGPIGGGSSSSLSWDNAYSSKQSWNFKFQIFNLKF